MLTFTGGDNVEAQVNDRDVVHPLAEGAEAPLDAVALDLAVQLPFRHRVEALEVIVEGGDDRWRRRWRIGLGVRP